jgi:uncharacterized damage-inducible protein DinB
MYRRISDFLADWKEESKSTKDVLGALTDESLTQRVTPTGRSIGKLGWHIAQSLHMVTEAGLQGLEAATEHEAIPGSARAILEGYITGAESLARVVEAGWTDAQLGEEVPMYGESWARGKVLSVIIRHEAHHRGQMTVLMRQAGLVVPGPYGPAREQWAGYGMEPQD